MHLIPNWSRYADGLVCDRDCCDLVEICWDVADCDTSEARPSLRLVIEVFTLLIILVSIPIEVSLRSIDNIFHQLWKAFQN